MKRKLSQMTLSWTVAGGILVVGGMVLWNQHTRREDLIKNQREVATRAVALELSLSPLRHLTDPPKSVKLPDRDRLKSTADPSPGKIPDNVKESFESMRRNIDRRNKAKDLGKQITTHQQCAEVLDLARKSGDEDVLRGLLDGIGLNLIFTKSSNQEIVDWLKAAALPQHELDGVINTITNNYEPKENIGKWLDAAAPMAPETTLKQVPFQMSRWTNADYKAAGEWLSGLAEGPIKQAAAATYATTAAQYDPQGSAAWVDTLPTGKKRREVAIEVYQKWLNDVPGRGDFADREGLKPEDFKRPTPGVQSSVIEIHN